MSNQSEKRAVLQAKGLCKGYGSGSGRVEALRDVDLCVYEGELLVILGSSGCGKSTLLNLIGGVDSPDSGILLVDGKNICNLSECELTDYGKGTDTADIMQMLGLSQRLHHYPSQLSGGEQQRVAIARALVKHARILLCDEPTGALDDKTGKQILKVLEQLVRRHGQTTILVTHTKEIAKMADRVIQMRSGRIDKEWVNAAPTPVEELTW